MWRIRKAEVWYQIPDSHALRHTQIDQKKPQQVEKYLKEIPALDIFKWR